MKPEEITEGMKVCTTHMGKPFCNTSVEQFPVRGWPGQALLRGVEEPVQISELKPYMASGLITKPKA